MWLALDTHTSPLIITNTISNQNTTLIRLELRSHSQSTPLSLDCTYGFLSYASSHSIFHESKIILPDHCARLIFPSRATPCRSINTYIIRCTSIFSTARLSVSFSNLSSIHSFFRNCQRSCDHLSASSRKCEEDTSVRHLVNK